MIRRLYLLLLILCTLAAIVLYGWRYAAIAGVPEADPFRVAADGIEHWAPPQVSQAIEVALARVEEVLGDVRWSFLVIFALFYVQLFIGRRRQPRSEKEQELQQRKKTRVLLTQIKMLFVATLLVALVLFGIEVIARQPTDVITVPVLGYELHRGNAVDFRRNVYHYGLLLAVAHLLAYVLFTWMALGFAARRAKKRASVQARSA